MHFRPAYGVGKKKDKKALADSDISGKSMIDRMNEEKKIPNTISNFDYAIYYYYYYLGTPCTLYFRCGNLLSLNMK